MSDSAFVMKLIADFDNSSTSIGKAVLRRDLEFIRNYQGDLNQKDAHHKTPLWLAILGPILTDEGEEHKLSNFLLVVELLLQRGANPNLEFWDGRTPLVYSIIQIARERHGSAKPLLENEWFSLFKLLLKYDADVNQPAHLGKKNESDQTNTEEYLPLTTAVTCGIPELVECLLEAGADPLKEVSGFMTAINQAVEDLAEVDENGKKGDLRIFRLLLGKIDTEKLSEVDREKIQGHPETRAIFEEKTNPGIWTTLMKSVTSSLGL